MTNSREEALWDVLEKYAETKLFRDWNIPEVNALLNTFKDEILAALSVPETENWEYGLAYGDEDPVRTWPMDLERARRKADPAFGDVVMRRRVFPTPEPGPWEPVPVEEDNR